MALDLDLTVGECRTMMLTVLLTIFISWALQEILEHVFGMAPAIHMAKDLHTNALKEDSVNPVGRWKLNNRLTRSLDKHGAYRIQTRGSIYFIKFIWNFLLFLVSFIVLCVHPEWYYLHFIKLDSATVDFLPYQHISASILAFYSWEVSANRYGKLSWSILIHHWLTSAAALSILMGAYTPFSTWYGFTGIALAWPNGIAFGLRATFSNKYPKLTQKMFRWTYYWYLGVIILNLTGQIFLIIMGIYTGNIHAVALVLTMITLIGWIYDDINLMKALLAFSKHNYEDGNIFDHKELSREIGGRLLFAQSILNDIENEELKTKSKKVRFNVDVKANELTTDNPHAKAVMTPTHSEFVQLSSKQIVSTEELANILHIDAQQYQTWMDMNSKNGTKSHTSKSEQTATPIKTTDGIETPTNVSLVRMSSLDTGDKADIDFSFVQNAQLNGEENVSKEKAQSPDQNI